MEEAVYYPPCPFLSSPSLGTCQQESTRRHWKRWRIDSGKFRRKQTVERLRRVYDLAASTGHLARLSSSALS